MRRREFLGVLGGAAAWPVAARAQQAGVPVIGVLYGVAAALWTNNMVAFRLGLGDAGFVEGRNVAIEYRWADGQMDRVPAMAADLVGRKVAVILAGGGVVPVQAAMAATKAIPIVFTISNDPIAAGFVVSLNRPGGNITGVTLLGLELGSKRLELLREVVPTVSRIALLVNPNNPVTAHSNIQEVQAAALGLKLEIIIVNGGTANEIDKAFASAIQQGATALFVGADGFLASRYSQIAALALRHALPTSAANREAAAVGMLMSYGSSQTDAYRQAGVYVGRILKGEKPADLPVQQPTRFELVINLTTAKALGLDIPLHLQQRADEVIE